MPVPLREWDNSVLSHRVAASFSRSEVQVWSATIPCDEEDLIELARNLSPDEHERADLFQADEPRRRFLFGRALLRQLLGACLNTVPSALAFGYGPRGKHFLNPPTSGGDLRFNLSHSGRLVVIALARGREVGVDLERIDRLPDWSLLAERIFSSRELCELRAIPASEQRGAFFNGWTRKEACLKATGEGLTDDLPGIEVTLSPGRSPGCWDCPLALKPRVNGRSKTFPCHRTLRVQLPSRSARPLGHAPDDVRQIPRGGGRRGRA